MMVNVNQQFILSSHRILIETYRSAVWKWSLTFQFNWTDKPYSYSEIVYSMQITMTINSKIVYRKKAKTVPTLGSALFPGQVQNVVCGITNEVWPLNAYLTLKKTHTHNNIRPVTTTTTACYTTARCFSSGARNVRTRLNCFESAVFDFYLFII